MRTRASHGTGKGRRSVLPVRRFVLSATLSGLPVITLALVFIGCGDSAQGDPDATPTGDGGITDAYVDEGPLDCGAPPYDGAICVHGRLHDWVTGEPVPAGRELRVYGFENGDFQEEARDAPDETHGRMDRNGRFYVWVNPLGHIECFATIGDVEGYLPATVNCYGYRVPGRPDRLYRLYAVPESVISGWVASYPGAARLDMDRPLFLGQCLLPDWVRPGLGAGTCYFNEHLPDRTWPCRSEIVSFSEDRRSFLGEVESGTVTRDIPAGGASIYYMPEECEGSEGELSRWEVGYICNSSWASSNFVALTLVSSGESLIVVLNTLMD